MGATLLSTAFAGDQARWVLPPPAILSLEAKVPSSKGATGR